MNNQDTPTDGTGDLSLTGGAQCYTYDNRTGLTTVSDAKPRRKAATQYQPYYRLEVGEAFQLTPKSRVMVAWSLLRYIDLDTKKFIAPWTKVRTFRPVKGASKRNV